MKNVAEPLTRHLVPISKLNLDPDNARRHNQRNLDAVATSLKRHGQLKPIVVQREGMVVRAGNGTIRAALSLGWKRIAAIVVDMTDEEATAFAIADNRTSDLAEWDADALNRILSDWDEPAIEALGFDSDELEAILSADNAGSEGWGTPAAVAEDEVPEVPDDPTAKRGQLWALGDHRVLCGDSTVVDDVARVMGGEAVAAVVTDPPYGTDQPGVPHDSPEEHAGLVAGVLAALPLLPDATVVSFASPRTFPVWLDAIREAGHMFNRMLWLYKEAQMANPWRGWMMKSEAILVSSVGSGAWVEVKPYANDCYKIAFVSIGNNGDLAGGAWHGSVKPLAVVADLLGRLSGLVYDPFLGSGTTLIAAEHLGRTCYGIEIEPRYVDVILQRWSNLTGKKATVVDNMPVQG